MNTKGAINVLLATNTRGRFFRSLGSRKAILSWDEIAKTVTISGRSQAGVAEEQIVHVNVQQVQHVFIMNGNYTFKINDQTFDMEIEHYKGQRALMHDLFPTELSDIASAFADAKSESEQLIRFLQHELPPQMLAISILRSKNRIKIAIPLAIAVVIFIAVLGFSSAANK